MRRTERYAETPELRGFLAEWRLTHRPPLASIDYMLEMGEEGLAAAFRWLASVPDRPMFASDTGWGRDDPSGPFPGRASDQDKVNYYWFGCADDRLRDNQNCVPHCVMDELKEIAGHKYSSESKPLPGILLDVLDALAAAHERGVLKPVAVPVPERTRKPRSRAGR